MSSVRAFGSPKRSPGLSLIRIRHYDPNIQRMFNDRQNVPQVRIETDRVVRIESK